MGAFLVGLMGWVSGPVKWLFSLLLDWVWSKLQDWLKAREVKKEQADIREDNLKKYNDALSKGDQDALEKAAADLLNGRDNRGS